jgi:hypothetical protein
LYILQYDLFIRLRCCHALLWNEKNTPHTNSCQSLRAYFIHLCVWFTQFFLMIRLHIVHT